MTDTASLHDALLQKADAEQKIVFNPNAALQKRIFADGFTPNSPEFELVHQDKTYIAQRSERLGDGAVHVYYCLKGDWGNVHFADPAQRGIAASSGNWAFSPAAWRSTIWSITSIFESGRPEGDPSAYQTLDAGIISYGRHQATLQSGSLGEVVEEYFRRSNSPTKASLQQEYAERIKNKDASLRHDPRIKELLLHAATEQEMAEAQDVVFDRRYYQRAIQLAQQWQVRTPLGLACLYDTVIQGGALDIAQTTKTKLGGIVGEGNIDEKRWLAVFLDEREAFLLRVADRHQAEGKHTSAQMLRTSTFRVKELQKLMTQGNLGLEGALLVRNMHVGGIVHS